MQCIYVLYKHTKASSTVFECRNSTVGLKPNNVDIKRIFGSLNINSPRIKIQFERNEQKTQSIKSIHGQPAETTAATTISQEP